MLGWSQGVYDTAEAATFGGFTAPDLSGQAYNQLHFDIGRMGGRVSGEAGVMLVTAGFGHAANSGRYGHHVAQTYRAVDVALNVRNVYNGIETTGNGISKVIDGDSRGWFEIVGGLAQVGVSGYDGYKTARTFGNARKAMAQATAAAKQAPSVSPQTPVGRPGKREPHFVSRNSPTVIDGRSYSGHAIDRLQARGFVPSVVKQAVRKGTRTAGNRPGTSQFTDSVNKLRVIVDNETGHIITVIGGVK